MRQVDVTRAVKQIAFATSVVNTSARTEMEFGYGIAKPDAGSEMACAIEVMAHSGRIAVAARIKMILLGGGPHTQVTHSQIRQQYVVQRVQKPPLRVVTIIDLGGMVRLRVCAIRDHFMSTRDFDLGTLVRELLAWSYNSKRLKMVLHRQWNDFRLAGNWPPAAG